MKNETNIKSVLGLTQEETSMLLGISRVQWAHFSDGRRDIPVKAKLKLAEVLSTIENNKKKSVETNKILETEHQKTQEWLQQEFKAIKFKEVELERKIKKIVELRTDAFKALEVVHYLELKKDISLARFIQIRAKNTLNKYNLQHLEALELKKEAHQMLKLQLQQKLKL